MSQHPYRGLPDYQFWARAVARVTPDDVDPVVAALFKIAPSDQVATSGSCFAQHISRALARRGFSYLVTEQGAAERNYGVFSARFGNIYTVRQLLQLFDRAYGLFEPAVDVWRREDGAYVDPFRPQVEPDGFASIEALRADRRTHLAAVRAMFERCDVFVFTLGLTEGWISAADGAVYPLAPGVAGAPAGETSGATFVNFGVVEMAQDLTAFVEKLRAVRPQARVILTVSPVPLVATYEPRHVLVSTVYSKSALRVVADMVIRSVSDVAYFPSYEIITGAHNGNRYFEADLRSIRPEGVDNVMRLFLQHYGGEGENAPPRQRQASTDAHALSEAEAQLRDLNKVICDEEALDAQ
ncbi:MAG: GSCFA domain-containing protein [Terricaulis sp.]